MSMAIKSINHDRYVLAFKNGEEKGFDYFYLELFPSLCFFANRLINDRYDAEDIVSNAFIKIWEKHSIFNSAKNIRSYLYQIVRNDCFKFHQQQKKVSSIKKEIGYLSSIDLQDNYEEEIIRSEFYGEIYKALDALPNQCRKIFIMLYIKGKSVKEIAIELNISPSTVKTQKARGIATLKHKLKLSSFKLFIFLTLMRL